MAGESHGIADPYGLSPVTYRATANEIERLIRAGYERMVALAEGVRERHERREKDERHEMARNE
jgi:hypothetical protein